MTFDGDDESPSDGVDAPEIDAPPPARRRAVTVSASRLTQAELEIGALLWPERNFWRPQRRGECDNVARPCPHVSCRYHLYLDVTAAGSIKFNHPGLEPWEIRESCALDIADRGGVTLSYVGTLLNLTRERVRQVELRALQRLGESDPAEIDIDDLRADFFAHPVGEEHLARRHARSATGVIDDDDDDEGDEGDDSDADDDVP